MLSKEQLERDFAVVLKCSNKNERLAWIRKRKKLDAIIQRLQPIEDAILQLVQKKEPIVEEIRQLREIMAKECVHSEEFLVHHGGYIQCKFCNVKLAVNRYWQEKNGE